MCSYEPLSRLIATKKPAMQIGPALFHVIAIFLVCLLACADGLGKNHDIDAILMPSGPKLAARMIILTSSICKIGKWQVRARPRSSLKSNRCDYKIFFRLTTISRCLVTWWLTTKTTVGRSISFPVRFSTLDMIDFSLLRTDQGSVAFVALRHLHVDPGPIRQPRQPQRLAPSADFDATRDFQAGPEIRDRGTSESLAARNGGEPGSTQPQGTEQLERRNECERHYHYQFLTVFRSLGLQAKN